MTEIDGAIAWLRGAATRLLKGCRTRAHDGTWLYTPDGQGHYAALWTRDFAYMLQHAGDLIPQDDALAAVRYLLAGVRETDGAAPDRVQADGVAVYVAGPAGAPMGEPNLDNGPFLVIAADACAKTFPREQSGALWKEWLPALGRAMDFVPRDEFGLVYNDPAKPHSPYGFTDTICKTGALFMESLLYWDACKKLAAAGAEQFAERAMRIERNIDALWDDKAGAFFAATKDCRQLDVWANAFVIDIEFPLVDKRDRVLGWLRDNADQFLLRGQVRHLLKGEYWQRTFVDYPRDTYQNGAYWATASGWMMRALSQIDPKRADELLADLLADFRTNGICECVNEGYRQLEDYVASATNPLGAVRKMQVIPILRN